MTAPLPTSPSTCPLKPQPLPPILPSGSVSPGYGNGLGAGAFPGPGAQAGEGTWGTTMWSREGEGVNRAGIREPGESCVLGGGQWLSLGGGMKPPKPGEPCPAHLGTLPTHFYPGPFCLPQSASPQPTAPPLCPQDLGAEMDSALVLFQGQGAAGRGRQGGFRVLAHILRGGAGRGQCQSLCHSPGLGGGVRPQKPGAGEPSHPVPSPATVPPSQGLLPSLATAATPLA